MRSTPKKSITDLEKEICLRVKKAREQVRWSQPAMAEALAISRDKLANIESCRTALRYDLANKLCLAIDLSQYWLATGKGDPAGYITLSRDALSETANREGELFSQVYEVVLSDELAKKAATKLKRNRSIMIGHLRKAGAKITSLSTGEELTPQRLTDAASRKLNFLVEKWVAAVPPDSLNDFVSEIETMGDMVARRYRKTS